MAEIRELIRTLESDEGYFTLINQKAADENILLRDAYELVEGMREELGMNRKHPTPTAFYMARMRYHRSGGALIRFQDDEK